MTATATASTRTAMPGAPGLARDRAAVVPPAPAPVAAPAVVAAPALATGRVAARADDDLRRMILFIGLGTFLTTVGNPLILASIPARFLLQQQLGVSPGQMAAFLALAGVAWYLKPLLALGFDSGATKARFRSVMLWSAGGSIALWAVMAIVPRAYAPLLAVFIALNLTVAIASVVLGGLLVREGQRHHATGRLTSSSMSFRHVGYLVVGPLGGWLAGMPFGVTCALGGLLVGALLVMTIAYWGGNSRREATAADSDPDPRAVDFEDAPRAPFRDLLRSRTVWAAAAMIFLTEIAPGFETPLFYYQTKDLGFDGLYIGWLQGAFSLAGLAAALAYATLCRRWNLRVLIGVTIVLSTLATLTYLAYRDTYSALFVSMLGGAATTLAFMPILDLASRATPAAWACVGFALMMCVRNGTHALSDVIGSFLFEHLGQSFRSLVWINAVTTAIVLLALPLLPRELLSRKDGSREAA